MTRHKLEYREYLYRCDQCDHWASPNITPEELHISEINHNLNLILDRLVDYPGKIPSGEIDPHFLVDALHEPLPLENTDAPN